MRGHHVALRVPSFEVEKQWFVEKLDFRVIQEWPYADQQLAYVAPPNDGSFFVEILGGGQQSSIVGWRSSPTHSAT